MAFLKKPIHTMNITDRFLKYVSFHTTSDENTHTTPSTARQLELGKYLREELIGLGLEEVDLQNYRGFQGAHPALPWRGHQDQRSSGEEALHSS